MYKRESRGSNRICLIDFRLSGHHPLYLSCFAQSFQMLGYSVDIFSPEVSKCQEKLLQTLPSLDLSNIRFVHTDASTNGQKRTLGCRCFFKLIKLQKEIELQEQAEGFRYTLVFFALLDDVAHVDFKLPYLLKSPFTKKFSGLLISPREKVLVKRPYIYDLLTTNFIQRRSANIHEVGVLVEDVQAEVEKILQRKTTLYPDFCLETLQVNVESSLKDNLAKRIKNRIVTGLFGSIFPRKSVDLLFECLQNSDPDVHFFVIAGKIKWSTFSPDQQKMMNEVISNPPENLLISDEWIESEAVFDSVFQMCDVIFAYYRNFTKSSNIITKSACYGIPIIVDSRHLMGERVQKYKLGYAKSEGEVIEMYRQNKLIPFEFDEKLLEEFRATHSVKRLPEIFGNLLQTI